MDTFTGGKVLYNKHQLTLEKENLVNDITYKKLVTPIEFDDNKNNKLSLEYDKTKNITKLYIYDEKLYENI